MTKEEVFSLETLEKGKRRYEKGKVKNIHMLDNMLYGSVYGNDLYKVKMEIVDNVVKKMNCSCLEAQLGKRCRHEAAVVLALENELHNNLTFELNDHHREDRVKWALSKMTQKEKEDVLYNYIKNDSKENRHMVIFKCAMKKTSDKEKYITYKIRDVIDSYENYYALIDKNDERLFEIVPQFAPIEITFPFLEEYFKEGKVKETFKLMSDAIIYLMKNSEVTFNVFADKLLTFYVNLAKYINDEKLVKLTYLDLRKALNLAPNFKERSLIYRKMVYGYIDESLEIEKLKDTKAFFQLADDKTLVEASKISEVFLIDALSKNAKTSKFYKDLINDYGFLPCLLSLKSHELFNAKKYEEAINLLIDSENKLKEQYKYELKDPSTYMLLANSYKALGKPEDAKKEIFKAFKLSPSKNYLLKLKELESKEEYQKDLLSSYLDLNDLEALELLFEEGYDGLALKIIDHNYNGKYALSLLMKNFDHFKNIDKEVLKEIINTKINEAMETGFAIKYSDVLNYAKLVYRVDGNKCEAIKILKIWGQKFKKDDKFVDLIEKEITALEK